jgi:type IV secretion system protein VirB4
MALQFRRYPESQIFAFDFGGSIRAAAIAMGGDWHDLGGAVAGESSEFVSLQPLARIDDVAERGWAADWISSILTRERIEDRAIERVELDTERTQRLAREALDRRKHPLRVGLEFGVVDADRAGPARRDRERDVAEAGRREYEFGEINHGRWQR